MAIPTYDELMLPLLKSLENNEEQSFANVVQTLAQLHNLTSEEVQKLLPSGKYPIFRSRVGWAKTYLSKAGLIEMVSKGVMKITLRGLNVLKRKPKEITKNALLEFPEFMNFVKKKKTSDENSSAIVNEDVIEISEQTPDEALETAYQTILNNLSSEILEKIKSCSPVFFEHLVVDLLVKMGYGGTREDAGERLGRSGDGGIDGIIKEDRLGLDIIYLQAKRWESVVGRPEIQKFAGALQGQRARKGVFITTSDFTKEAREYVSHIESKIILIDGEELAELMLDYNVGVSNAAIYEIKKVDSDYFIED